jgi:ferredoxin
MPYPALLKIKKKELLHSWRREKANSKENNLFNFRPLFFYFYISKMNKNFFIFIEKFKVPKKLRNSIQKILSEDEVLVLNYLANREEKISTIISEFPLLKRSLAESLYKKGYLIKQPKKGDNYYRSNTFDQIIKKFVTHNPKYKELSDEVRVMLQECISGMYLKRMKASKKPMYRVVPIEETIQDKRQLIPYYQAIHYVQEASAIALIDCICRTTFNRCDKPRKVCFAFGEQAEFFIDRGLGEEIDIRKAQEVLDTAEENGLVHSVNNIKNPNFLCNCCECCCVFVQALKILGIFTSIGKSGFFALLDEELCNQCGICVDKCIFGAISDENESIKFDEDKCFGCGLCAYSCPQDAVRLVLEENEKKIS